MTCGTAGACAGLQRIQGAYGREATPPPLVDRVATGASHSRPAPPPAYQTCRSVAAAASPAAANVVDDCACEPPSASAASSTATLRMGSLTTGQAHSSSDRAEPGHGVALRAGDE